MSEIIKQVKSEIEQDQIWVMNEKNALAQCVKELEGKIDQSLTPTSNHAIKTQHSVSNHNVEPKHLKFDDINNLDTNTKKMIHRAALMMKMNPEEVMGLLLTMEDEEFNKKLDTLQSTSSSAVSTSAIPAISATTEATATPASALEPLLTLPQYQKIGELGRQQYLQSMRDLLLAAIRNSNLLHVKQILHECPKALLFTFIYNPSNASSIPISSMSIPSILHHSELKPSLVMNGNNKLIEQTLTKTHVGKITFLHLACQQSDPLLVEYLLQYYDDVNIQTTDGRTPLFYTTSSSIITLLCQEGCNPNHIDRKGLCPLHLYTSSALYSCVEIILQYGGDPLLNDSKKRINSLFISAKKGDYHLLSLLLSSPGSLSQTSTTSLTTILNQYDYEGNTLLHYLTTNTTSSSTSVIKSIMLLLNLDCNPLIKNQRGITPLHFLIANQSLWNYSSTSHDEILQLIQLIFLQHHTHLDINIHDNDHCTLLIIACAHRKFDLCKFLLLNKADMNIPCPMNSYMLRRDNPAVQEEMLEGMDCTASDLFPPGRKRAEIFANISSYQTPIPLNSRLRCMNCAKSFNSNSFTSVFLKEEKYNCRMCGRLVCGDCVYPADYTLSQLPSFLLEGNNAPTDVPLTTLIKLCIVCQPILVENFDLEDGRR